jgi:hypothetical protein
LSTIVGDMLESGLFAGATALASAPTQSKEVRDAGLRRKIIHLVVQNDAGSGHDDLRPESSC